MVDSRPWLTRSAWHGGVARSDGKRQLFVHWLGAIVWNLFGAALVFAIWSEGWSSFPALLRVLLLAFAAMGIPIMLSALVYTARVLRFRNLRLELDPFPGSIGGQAGGTLDLPLRRGTKLDARVTLQCIHSHMRGSGEDRSRREDVVWSSEVVPEVERSGTGVRLAFTFDIPENHGLAESEPADDPETEDYHYWSVHVAAELPGADLDQSFRVPVYRVDPPLTATRPASSRGPSDPQSASRGIDVDRIPGGVRITYRRARFGVMSLGLLAFGAFTMTSGLFVFTQAGLRSGLGIFGMVFGGIFLVAFGVVGGLCMAFGAYMLLSHRTVEVADGLVRSEHAYGFGTSVREARVDDIDRITAKVTMQSGQGSRARTAYDIDARLRSGQTLKLGDGIRGAFLLDQLRSVIEAETGIGVEVSLRRR